MRRFTVVAACAAVTLVGGTAVGGCAVEDDSSTPAPDKGNPTAERQGADEQGEEPQGGRVEDGDERDDLVSFQIDDRSQAGFDDIWVTWTITNRSSEKSDYTWEWEAVGPDGERLYNSTEFVTDVQPGQTATGESPTTLKTPGVKINITEFERSKAW